MISFRSQHSAYFNISSKDIKSLDKAIKGTNINERVTSLSITEERGKMITGSITFEDNIPVLFDVLKRGAIVNIEWGYKDPQQAAQQVISKKQNSTEIVGPIFRQGLKCVLTSPKTQAKPNGDITTTMMFRSGFSLIANRKIKTYKGTKGTVVTQAIAQTGAIPQVNFKSQAEPVGRKGIKQDRETDFQFLRRLANSWGAFLRMGHTPAGQDIVIFADDTLASALPFSKIMTGGIGNDHLFDYRDGQANVLEYSVEYVFTQDGGGDNVQISIIDTSVVERRSTAKTEKVVGYRFLPKKMEAAIRKTKTPEEATKLRKDVLNSADFQAEGIQQFWKPFDYSTAIQTGGFKIGLKVFGNPLFTPPHDVKFGLGFPEDIRKIKNMKIRKATHTINRQGYYTGLEIRNFYKQ